jgi:hypothetical protein
MIKSFDRLPSTSSGRTIWVGSVRGESFGYTQESLVDSVRGELVEP